MKNTPLFSLLQEAVSIPSITPSQTRRPEWSGEQRIGQWFAGQLAQRGFAVEWQEVEPGRPNVIGYFGPETPRHTIMFESHLDTVGVDGMTHDPFSAEIRDGRLYGRGASDCKGAMAAALHALDKPTLDALSTAGVGVIYLGAMGEETGNYGARAWQRQTMWEVDQCVVLEPTELIVVHGHKGICWFGITLHGRSAHGSNPDVGVNAILAANECVSSLQALARKEALIRHEVLGSPTLNIGVIQAGIAPNVVPASCRIELDWRMIPPASKDEAMEKLRALLEPLKQRGACLGYELVCMHETPPMLTAPDSAVVRQLSAGLTFAGVQPRCEGAAWCSDASIFSAACPQAVAFGPGSIKQAHASTEFIELDELAQGTLALSHWLRAQCAPDVG